MARTETIERTLNAVQPPAVSQKMPKNHPSTHTVERYIEEDSNKQRRDQKRQ